MFETTLFLVIAVGVGLLIWWMMRTLTRGVARPAKPRRSTYHGHRSRSKR